MEQKTFEELKLENRDLQSQMAIMSLKMDSLEKSFDRMMFKFDELSKQTDRLTSVLGNVKFGWKVVLALSALLGGVVDISWHHISWKD